MNQQHLPASWTGEVGDAVDPKPILSSTPRYDGRIWSVRTDEVQWSEDTVIHRDFTVHTGAVGIIALDSDDRVLLVRQYRHPVGMYLFEPPAGLLDVAGEPPLETAQRELLEEAGLTAQTWHVLYDCFTTPGGSTEAFRCFLARDLSLAPSGRSLTGEAEESELPQAWVPLDEAKDLVLAGKVQNPTAVSGILAAWSARAEGWANVRTADAPWPAREALLDTGRVFLG